MAKQTAGPSSRPHTGFQLGENYLVHTHLGIWLGRIIDLSLDEITLDQCSWIPEQGRMSASVATGSYDECEFVGDGVIVPRNAIKVPWRHDLPTKSKP